MPQPVKNLSYLIDFFLLKMQFLASGEDPQCTTPKSRKNDPYGQSHLAGANTSPGGPHVVHSVGPPSGEDYDSPPNWSRTPTSPVS